MNILPTHSSPHFRTLLPPMALPTPPNSGKEALRHRFASKDEEAAYPPLFAPIERPASPSDAVLFRRRSSSSSTAMKRSWSDASHSNISHAKRQRIDSPLENTERDAPLFTRLAPLRRDVSPPLPGDYQLASWFANHYPPAFQQEQEDLGNGLWTVVERRRLTKPMATVRRRKGDSMEPEEDYKPRGKPSHSRRRSAQLQVQQTKDAKTTRSPANKAAVSKDYRDWPDYSPPVATLEHARSIAEGMTLMSGRKDLSGDPLRDELHPVELIAANHAGIDCGRYLCTKRSVFVGYLKHLLYKHGKRELTQDEQKKGLRSWNKTAAQNCSSIDVNKTSCLFAEFWSRTDWFNERHFTKYIELGSAVKFPVFDKDGHLVNND